MPCYCGGCRSCLLAQGYEPCPDCGAFMGCDCVEEAAMKNDPEQYEAQFERDDE